MITLYGFIIQYIHILADTRLLSRGAYIWANKRNQSVCLTVFVRLGIRLSVHQSTVCMYDHLSASAGVGICLAILAKDHIFL